MPSYKPSRHDDDEILYKKLLNTLFAIIVVVMMLFLGLRFFGPKIGSFFGLISRNRNNQSKGAKIPPTPPFFINPPKATNASSLKIEGIAEAGTELNLFVNGPKKSTVIAGQNGEFTFIGITLNNGKNTIFATATDKGGNVSEKSETLTVVYDNTKPKIELIDPKEDEKVSNIQNRIKVTGKINEKAQVMVNDRIAITKPDNSFEILLGVEEGEVEINIEATDEAGNTAEKKFKIFYNND